MNENNRQEIHKNGSTGQLISANTFAELLSVSKRTLSRLQSKGILPPPIRLGRSVRWRLDIVHEWIENGCPHWNAVL